jgi:hypothetical protein
MNGIVKWVFVLLLLYGLNSKAQIVIPHCDFNNWTVDSMGNTIPDGGWIYSYDYFDTSTVSPDIDRSGGAGFSLKMISVFDSLQGFYQGGSIQLNDQPFTGSVRPNTLTGYWKFYNPNITDLIAVAVSFYNSAHDEIGQASINTPFTGSINNWTLFSTTIHYTSNDPIVTYDVLVALVNGSDDTTIYGHVDDLSLDVTTDIPKNSLEELQGGISYYDGKNILTVEKKVSGSLKIDVIDLNGKLISTTFDGDCMQGQNIFDVDLKNQCKGLYFCRVRTEGLTKLFKIKN